MHAPALLIALAMAAAAIPAPLAAQPAPSGSTPQSVRVDDSGTVVLDPFLEMQWQPIGRAPASNIVSGSTRVSVQLNVADWMGQKVRIYMALPRMSGPSVRATWTTGGVMLPGSLISGDRALVFGGLISAPILRDVLTIRLEADGTRLNGTEALAFGFEAERGE